MRFGWIALVAVVGCKTDPPGYTGYQMEGYFPFDGARTWEFVDVDDTTVPYKLVATLSLEPEDRDGFRIYDVEYARECVGADETCEDGFEKTLRMSADFDGIRLHGYEDIDGVDTFDPPLKIADGRMLVGDAVTTETGGASWTVTFSDLVAECPVQWTDQWEKCAEFTITSDGEHPLVGKIWAITGWNIVAWQPEGGDQWQLSRATYFEE